MKRSEQITNRIGGVDLWMTVAATALATLLIVAATQAQGQTFTVIHSFSGRDGANPYAGLSIDRAGNLYGTSLYGGDLSASCPGGCGTVFKLAQRGSGWVLSKLYEFTAGPEGYPQARVIFGPEGFLYGTASGFGGYGNGGYGAVFNLRPPATVCKSVSCPWTETVLFSFDSGTGFFPLGDLTFDAAGNIYGTTQYGGLTQYCSGGGCGVAYQLTQSGGVWTETILHAFTLGDDGGYPNSGVIFDRAGNLYGTAPEDTHQGRSDGLIYELSPSSSGWTQNVLYYFQAGTDGADPYAGLSSDIAGNLYGAAAGGGSNHGGTVFQLTPSGGTWDFSTLYGLPQGNGGSVGPYGTLVMDAAGNLYGTTLTDGAYGNGSVFKLTPSNGGWIYTDLHDFTDHADGGQPYGTLVLDANGNIYGTAFSGGNFECQGDFGCGVVFEITP